ncbi:unnamed protein product [Echinostoma caproni]|uniref:Acyltransferase n=1 Tax=Echinostoma caproni TaxID=27848 RepID=A0A183AA05_9TREM|nr:unnamed protein product [Echinostoma caproni]
MTHESDFTDSEVQADIQVRTRRVSEVTKPGTRKKLKWHQLLSVDYVLQYVCTLIWVSFFMFMALSSWMLWFTLVAWLLLQLPHMYTIYTASRREGSDVSEMEFDRVTFRFIAVLICFLAYQIHWILDRKSEERGSHPKPWVRKLVIWGYLRRYFPINMILSDEIRLQQQQPKQNQQTDDTLQEITCNPILFPADQNYLVGYHPHGIFGVGAFVNFGTEATGFSRKFPQLTPWLTTLEINFKAPIHRDLLQSFSASYEPLVKCTHIVSATYAGISYLLDPNKCGKRGNMVIVVLGGAPEALDSRPGKYVFHTNRRYGFFKLALMTGSALVPCISFGEPNMYHQVENPPGCRLRSWQDRFTEMATFSPPIFYARMLVPYRTPINTVVGAPIPVPLVEKPSREQVANLKELYLENLNKLFQKYKPIYDPDADEVEFF